MESTLHIRFCAYSSTLHGMACYVLEKAKAERENCQKTLQEYFPCLGEKIIFGRYDKVFQ